MEQENLENIELGKTRLITGNNIVINIGVNRGILRVVGNKCHVTVECNLGTVTYIGNQGHITIKGNLLISTLLQKKTGHISVTGVDINVEMEDTSHPQMLQLVGTGVLQLSQATHVLKGYTKLKIKHGCIKKPKVKQQITVIQTQSTVQTSSCGLFLYTGGHGASHTSLTRKHFGLK